MRVPYIIIVLAMCLSLVYACLKTNSGREFTGIYEDKTCSSSLDPDNDLPKIFVKNDVYKLYRFGCYNDVKVILYSRPKPLIQDLHLDDFYDRLIRKTNETIKKELKDCFVTVSTNRCVTNYYLVKILKEMNYNGLISLQEDHIVLNDLVCKKSYDNTGSLGHLFDTSFFILIVHDVQIQDQMKDKDKQINNKDDIDPKPTDDDLSYIARNKAFFVDEETSTENLHKHTKERLKHEKSVFRKSFECFKKVTNSSGTKNSFYSENKISLQKVGIFTPPKKMVVPSTGITIHPKGLVNKRNDCFLNATMQVLLSIKSFGDYYYTCKDQKILSIALKEFINNYSKNKYLNPEKLISQLRSKMKFIDGNEQDAHEFLVSLLNILYIEQGGTDSIITSQDELEETQRTNYIAKTFYGMQKNIILCLKCNNKSEGYQETSILSCELQKNVESVLHEYTKSEKILYACPKCGMTEGIKKFEIVSHSKIMIIHLKRFNHNGRKNYTKIDVCRDFDFYGSYYRLLGAIVHIGDTESGHYYSEAIRNGKWVRFDDMVIQDIEENKNDLRDAYILFYERTNKL